MSARATVIVFPGSNGDRDLFETFERAGFETRYHDSREPLPNGLDLVGLPGGFAYGDYWRAGMLASQAAAIHGIKAHVDRGGLAIGICNGFQILVEAGLLPGALRNNEPNPVYHHRWIEIEHVGEHDSPWLAGSAPGQRLRMPMAHGEGNYFHPEGPDAIRDRIAFRYVNNPNGSMGNAAALLDPTGRILGVMPHPERASLPLLGSEDGARLFEAAHRYCEQRA